MMKRRSFSVIFKSNHRKWFLTLTIFLIMAACNFGIPEYRLTVVLEEGVTGTPATGVYFYKSEIPQKITLDYDPVDPEYTVEVLINGGKVRQPGNGSVTLYGDGYEMRARLIDFRGTYTLKFTYTDTTIKELETEITLSGDSLIMGTFTDSRGFQGTWRSNALIITLVYSDWLNYVLIGSSFDMNGAFSGDSKDGTWKAARKT